MCFLTRNDDDIRQIEDVTYAGIIDTKDLLSFFFVNLTTPSTPA